VSRDERDGGLSSRVMPATPSSAAKPLVFHAIRRDRGDRGVKSLPWLNSPRPTRHPNKQAPTSRGLGKHHVERAAISGDHVE
ncbi:hypothetical protein SB781_38745, partial [Paraburkholderia sp. SIMBA_061]